MPLVKALTEPNCCTCFLANASIELSICITLRTKDMRFDAIASSAIFNPPCSGEAAAPRPSCRVEVAVKGASALAAGPVSNPPRVIIRLRSGVACKVGPSNRTKAQRGRALNRTCEEPATSRGARAKKALNR